MIFYLPTNIKERYFFIGGRNWVYNPANQEDTLGIPIVWTALENLHEFPFVLVRLAFKGYEVFLTFLWLCCLQVSVPTSVPGIRR